MPIKNITNYVLLPFYMVLVGLVLYAFMVRAYMFTLSFIGALTVLYFCHSQLNGLYDYIGRKINK